MGSFLVERLQGCQIDESLRKDMCEIWLEELINHQSVDVCRAFEQIYNKKNTGVDVLREQASSEQGGVYVAWGIGKEGLLAVARVSTKDSLGLSEQLCQDGSATAVYLDNYAVKSRVPEHESGSLFREIVNRARRDLILGRVAFLRRYLDERSEVDRGCVIIDEHVRAINPPTYEYSDGVMKDGWVGGVNGDWRLHSVQFPDEHSQENSQETAVCGDLSSRIGRVILSSGHHCLQPVS